MRNLEYLSPSSISIYMKDKKEFYLQYLSDVRAPRFAQTKPMSIGSAFDAYAKSFLYENLFGKNPKFELITLFEAQVESQNRDWAFEHGAYAFDWYKRSGALSDLMLELKSAVGEPRFEFEIKGIVNGEREGITRTCSNVTLLGRPDIFYINRFGIHTILDFKVNGWCSKSPVSPMKGYLKIRSGQALNISNCHKECVPGNFKGTVINLVQYLNDLNVEWAQQLAIYAWLAGCEIGEEFIAAIDQMVCKPIGAKFPEVRIAEHRLRIQSHWQWQLFTKIQEIWEIIHSNHYYRELSLEDSLAQCQMHDKEAKSLKNPANVNDAMFNIMTRG